MKPVSCNFCGSNAALQRYTLRDWLTKKAGEFSLVRCQNCGLMYLNPQPTWEELEAYYPDQYHAYRAPTKGGRESLLQKIQKVGWRRRSRAIVERCASGRLLDIGCATGEFLAEMELQQGWDCYGVEPVAYAAGLARQNTRAQIFEGVLFDAHYPDNFFDVITVWDVLEHTDDPAGMLREACRILRPGGMLVIRLPDPESLTAQWFGPHWIALDAPRHLFHFPKSILTRRLNQEQFSRIEITYLSSDHFTFFGSLSILLASKGWKRLGRLSEKVAYSPLTRALLAVAFLPFRWLGTGSSPVYFAWKP